jgi:DUF1680 family protein
LVEISQTSTPISFPLMLRIPGWCTKPVILVLGVAIPAVADNNGFVTIARTWRNGDVVQIALPASATCYN